MVGSSNVCGWPDTSWEATARQLAVAMHAVSAGFAARSSVILPFGAVVVNAREWHAVGEGTPNFASLTVLHRHYVALRP